MFRINQRRIGPVLATIFAGLLNLSVYAQVDPAGFAIETPGRSFVAGSPDADGDSHADGVIYDTLCIVDDGGYQSASGNAIAGRAVYDTILDLSVADDFELVDSARITRLVEDTLSFFGTAPADGVLVEFYADFAGAPDERPLASCIASGREIKYEPFEDVVFGFFGGRISVDLTHEKVILGAGKVWVSITPLDTSSDGDWYFSCRSTAEVIGADSHARDAGAHSHGVDGSAGLGGHIGGYGTDEWVAHERLGQGAGTVSRRIEGESGVTLPLLLIEPSLRVAGRVNEWTVERCTLGSRVALLYSERGAGLDQVLGCAVDILSPEFVKVTEATEETMRISIEIRRHAAGLTTWEQAVSDDVSPCRVSNVVTGDWL